MFFFWWCKLKDDYRDQYKQDGNNYSLVYIRSTAHCFSSLVFPSFYLPYTLQGGRNAPRLELGTFEVFLEENCLYIYTHRVHPFCLWIFLARISLIFAHTVAFRCTFLLRKIICGASSRLRLLFLYHKDSTFYWFILMWEYQVCLTRELSVSILRTLQELLLSEVRT